jgi:hypothetical protein
VSTGSSVWLSLIRIANKRTKNNRTLRRVGIRTYSSVVRAHRFLPPPRVLLNGPPKSGTHLLSDCLSLMPKMVFSGRHFALADFFVDSGVHSHHAEPYPKLREAALAKVLRRCPRGMFVTAHARFHPILEALIRELQFKQVLLLRDPRDVVVSHAFYVKREPLHFHHTYFTETLKSDEQRIMATIRGFGSDVSHSRPLPPIGESFAGFVRWLDDPFTLAIRFEDLIDSRGTGDKEKQLNTVKTIGDFVGRPIDGERAQFIAQKMYGKGSLTFRKGQAGDWRNHFTEAHRHAFKETAGDMLVRLGYERDVNW